MNRYRVQEVWGVCVSGMHFMWKHRERYPAGVDKVW